MKKLTPDAMPLWTESAGGREKWAKWAEGQVRRCEARANKWLKKTRSRREAPGRKKWREAILAAVNSCGGRGHYSKLPISLNHEQGPTYSMWPSVEHLVDPATAEVALETRLVNDMATIMDESEFKKMIGHLSAAMAIEPEFVADDWHPDRSFAIKQDNDEPPLPS